MPPRKTDIDSPFKNPFRTTQVSYTEAPGKYDEGPIGPKGVNGGFPLKFTDESIKTPKGAVAGPSMDVVPASQSKS